MPISDHNSFFHILSNSLSSIYYPNVRFFIVSILRSSRMRDTRKAYRILVERPEGKRPLGRPRRRWVDNIKMDLREIGWDGMDWIELAQDRDQWRALVNRVMNLRVP
jgi:hypothetical protein